MSHRGVCENVAILIRYRINILKYSKTLQFNVIVWKNYGRI